MKCRWQLFGGRGQHSPSLWRSQASGKNVSAVAAVPSRPNIRNQCVLLTRVTILMDESGGGENLWLPKHSGLCSGYPTCSLLPAQSPIYSRSRRFSPAPSCGPHPGRRAGLRRPPRGPAARGTRWVRPRSLGRRQWRSETARRRGGAPGAGPESGQSAREAAARPRLAGPAGCNLPGGSRCFEPLHPLAALRLLQPSGPKKRSPGVLASGGKRSLKVPPAALLRAMCARRERGFSRRLSHGRY